MARRIMTFFGLFVINQDETGVKLTLGKYSGPLAPGLGFMLPIFQKGMKTKGSLQTIDLPDQQIVLSGNIAVTISGNLNFRVLDPAKALLQVKDYTYTVQRLALTTISDVLGTKTIDEIRDSKAALADDIEVIVAGKAEEWGLSSIDIRLTDAKLDESLQRAMTRETEAQKEAGAIRIKAEGDLQVSQVFAQAAETLTASPGAMLLRVLQTLSDISSEKSTVVIPIPIELMSMAQSGAAVAPHTQAPAPAASAAPAAQATTDAETQLPFARLLFRDGTTLSECPKCKVHYDVAEVIDNPEFDQDPDVPGLQLRCSECDTMFTLP
jgi:regulator of protease activity HflC (stomatin/prohibitin superfamily)